MVWLLSGLVLVIGLVVLVMLAVTLVGRLRRNRTAVTGLRITLRDGSSRLKAGLEHIREWRVERRATGSTGPGA
jgi:hypothetical protein